MLNFSFYVLNTSLSSVGACLRGGGRRNQLSIVEYKHQRINVRKNDVRQ